MSFLHTNWKCSTTSCIRMFMVDLFMTDQIGANATSPRRARLATCRKKGTLTSQVNLIDFSPLHQLDYFFFHDRSYLFAVCAVIHHVDSENRLPSSPSKAICAFGHGPEIGCAAA